MQSDLALRLMADLLWTALWVTLPVLGLTLVVGVTIGVGQVVTQVQEMSLAFIPKLVTAGAVLIFGGPWMLSQLSQFTVRVWSQMGRLS